ncbi:triose-phosphate isomerase [Candidatus Woesearchaeota archaeon]|nr:triose-phosphate isomerase [Candidatus Woesearchaeota archaeon]
MGACTLIAVINFKTYAKGTGASAVHLAKICASVAAGYPHVHVILAVQAADLNAVSSAVTIPVIAQHVDPIMYGSHTGHTLLEAVRDNGAKGSLVNHSEHRLPAKECQQVISRLNEEGLLSVLCVKDPDEARRYERFGAQFIAVEPPKLIGGKVSVVSANPKIITDTVTAVKNTQILVGAGIHETADVKKAVELGAFGILVASDVLKAKDPRRELSNLLEGFEHATDFH